MRERRGCGSISIFISTPFHLVIGSSLRPMSLDYRLWITDRTEERYLCVYRSRNRLNKGKKEKGGRGGGRRKREINARSPSDGKSNSPLCVAVKLYQTQKKKTKNKKREEENKQNSVPKINKYHIVKCETSIGRRGGGEATKKTRPDERTLRE